MRRSLVSSLLCLALLSGCAGAPGVAGSTSNAKLVQGPPISDIVTPFDKALTCLNGRIARNLVFSVGAVLDQTGKESFTDGGVGKFVTQGAGDMIQSALFKAGATVVNRRDPRVMTTEAEWRIRDTSRQIPSNFYITGSINSLDFIPGSGAEVEVGGVGVKYRQNRILIGLDLAMTDANSGLIVANVPLQKQIFSSEAGIGVGRFIGDQLTSIDFGGREREAIHFALRQMLNLSTFELLTQVMNANNFADCREYVDRGHGYVDHTKTAEAVKALATSKAAAKAVGALPPGVAGPIPSAGAAARMPQPQAAAPATPAAAQKEKPYAGASGNFAGSNGSGEDTSAQAKAQAILTQ
ncbi:CsgG/HfaB family protein [Aureimonas sp. AU22]|uniref:CsgG/HfaB family protein n=1 Tax=Aureimonas sp. AU22 TaxID=1638162 RepID=UPI000783C211|nr:CsgG/HfaB family protein [Aureimonas sp. AU22]